MLSKERIEESRDLIRRHLVKSHTDKDENSLFVRFSEIMSHMEDMQFRLDGWDRAAAILSAKAHTTKGDQIP